MRGFDALERRVQRLEGPTRFGPIACVLVREGESVCGALDTWETTHGPWGARTPWIVKLVTPRT